MALDDMIRICAPHSRPETGPDEKLVLFDVQKKQIVDKRSIWPLSRQRIKQYLVISGRPVRYIHASKLESKRSGNIDVDVICDITCPAKNERKLVQSLGGEESPSDMIGDLLDRTIHQLVDEEVDPVLRFFEIKEHWEKTIKNVIKTHTGLEAIVSLDAGKDALEPITITKVIKVHVQDYPEDIPLSFLIDLEVIQSDDARAKAMRRVRPNELSNEIERSVRRAIREQLTIHKLCLDFEKIRPSLRTIINKIAARYGREVEHLRVDPKFPFELPKFEILEISTSGRACDGDGEIQVSHTVLFDLEKLDVFLNSNLTNLKQWVQDELSNTTRQVFISRDLTTLASQFETDAQPALRLSLEASAKSAGLVVKTYLARVALSTPTPPEETISGKVDAYAKDCEDRIEVSYELRVQVPYNLRNSAIMAAVDTNAIINDLSTPLYQWIRTNCSIDDAYRDPQKIRDRLREVIRESVRQHHRELVSCTIDIDCGFVLPEFDLIAHSHTCRISEIDNPIEILHKLYVQWDRVGGVSRYRRSNVTDLVGWIKNSMEQIASRTIGEENFESFVANFDSTVRLNWENELKEILYNLGLDLKRYQPSFETGEDPLSTRRVKEEILLFANDCSEELWLAFDVQLQVLDDKQARDKALLAVTQSVSLREAIIKALKETTLRTDVTKICTEQTSMDREFRQEIATTAKKYGRSVEYFSFQFRFPFELPSFDIISFSHNCTIKDSEVKVLHRVLLKMVSVGNFLKANIPAKGIKEWLQEKLKQTTQDQCFGKTFTDIVLNFDGTIQDEIKNKVKKYVEEAGLDVEHFSSIVDVEAKRLITEGFKLDEQLHCREFKTKDPRVPVTLSMFVKGRLTELQKLENFLRPTTCIHDLILEKVIEATQELLHDTTPEEFYVEFQAVKSVTSPNDQASDNSSKINPAEDRKFAAIAEGREITEAETVNGKKNHNANKPHQPVERRIQETIKERLSDAFAATCDQITVKQADTFLSLRHQALMQSRPEFKITIRANAGTSVDYEVGFRIMGVVPDKWSVFQNGGFWKTVNNVRQHNIEAEVEDIRTFVRDQILQKLDHNLPMEYLQYGDDALRRELEEFLFIGLENDGIYWEVENKYGLSIEVTKLRRDDAAHEAQQRDITDKRLLAGLNYTEERLANLRHQLRGLEKRETEILLSDPDEAELEEIRAQMQPIKDALESTPEMTELLKPHQLPSPAKGQVAAPKSLKVYLKNKTQALLSDESGTSAKEKPKGETET